MNEFVGPMFFCGPIPPKPARFDSSNLMAWCRSSNSRCAPASSIKKLQRWTAFLDGAQVSRRVGGTLSNEDPENMRRWKRAEKNHGCFREGSQKSRRQHFHRCFRWTNDLITLWLVEFMLNSLTKLIIWVDIYNSIKHREKEDDEKSSIKIWCHPMYPHTEHIH